MKDAGGVYLGEAYGRKLFDRGNEHVAVIGPTRCGKDQSIIVPTFLDGWWGSTISHDPKGELWETVSRYRSSYCHQFLFDLTDPSSVGINALDWVGVDRKTGQPRVRDVYALIHTLTMHAREDHWLRATRKYLSAGAIHLLGAAPDKDKSFGGLNRFVARGDRGLHEMREAAVHETCVRLADEMLSVGKKADDGEEELAPSAYRGSVYNTASTFLQLWEDEVVDRITSRSEFHVSDLMCADDPIDLYLYNRPSVSEVINPYLRVILATVRRSMMHDPKTSPDGRVKNHRLLMNYNELLELRAGDEDRAARSAAAYGIKFLFTAQSLIDVERELGNGLLNNCAIRVFFRPNDDREAERISKMIGFTKVVVEHTTTTMRRGELMAGTKSVSPREEKVPILPQEEIMGWEPRKWSVVMGAGKPIRSDIKMAYLDPKLKRRFLPPPVVREDEDGPYLDLPGGYVSPYAGRFVEVKPRPRPEPKEAVKTAPKKEPAKRGRKPKASSEAESQTFILDIPMGEEPPQADEGGTARRVAL